jgi:MoaA/NifB/PqqE/SkfB family radical SAM enzyme
MDIFDIHCQKNINIDIGVSCTLECSACVRQRYRARGQAIPGANMTLPQFDKISNFFRGKSIHFCGTWSDPIFNPNFIDMLKMCEEKDIFANVYTAASHKPKDWYIEAFEANKRAEWVFGIDGLPEQSHLYRKNQDGLKLFDIMLTAKSMKIETVWQYIIFPYNKDNIKHAKKIAKKHKIRFLLIESER